MDFYCDLYTKSNLILEAFLPSSIFQLNIKFHFFFESDYIINIYTLNQLENSTTPRFRERLPTSYDASTSAAVAVGESSSFEDIRAAVGEAVGDRLPGGHLDNLIELACEEVLERFPATETLPMYTTLHLCFDVRILHRHVYVVESDYPSMVPAADSSFALLEKYEVDRVKEEEEEEEEEISCCICLEELRGGGGALRMPCSHVFHGGCIKEWLRSSHYCPLCRYEMPTE